MLPPVPHDTLPTTPVRGDRMVGRTFVRSPGSTTPARSPCHHQAWRPLARISQRDAGHALPVGHRSALQAGLGDNVLCGLCQLAPRQVRLWASRAIIRIAAFAFDRKKSEVGAVERIPTVNVATINALTHGPYTTIFRRSLTGKGLPNAK